MKLPHRARIYVKSRGSGEVRQSLFTVVTGGNMIVGNTTLIFQHESRIRRHGIPVDVSLKRARISTAECGITIAIVTMERQIHLAVLDIGRFVSFL